MNVYIHYYTTFVPIRKPVNRAGEPPNHVLYRTDYVLILAHQSVSIFTHGGRTSMPFFFGGKRHGANGGGVVDENVNFTNQPHEYIPRLSPVTVVLHATKKREDHHHHDSRTL